MAPRKAGEVDGFMALKAAQRAVKKAPAAPVPPAPPSVAKDSGGAQKKIGSHIGKTTMPTRHEVVCYECGFFFQMTGRPKSTFCPKCKANLTFSDHSIETAWSESLKTAGSILIGPAGVVTAGEFIATDIIVEGRVEGGALMASRFLEVRAGATVTEQAMKSRDLRIAAGASVKLTSAAVYRNVDIAGRLRARLKASGTVNISASGCFEGELTGAHLTVEEGGGLRARLHVEADVKK